MLVRTPDITKQYRHVLIVESRNWWPNCRNEFDPKSDLVLTYDFGLRREIECLGGQVLYIDHLLDQSVMQENNFLAYRFFKDWHVDRAGRDIFEHRGIPFGFAFRIEIWNDYIYYVRHRICLESLRGLRFKKVFAGTQIGVVEGILHEMEIPFVPVQPSEHDGRTAYFFPIHRWMDEKIRGSRWKHRFKDLVTTIQSLVMAWIDRAMGWHEKPTIFIQEYYPTKDLLQCLKQNGSVKLMLAHFSWTGGWFKYLTERPIAVHGRIDQFQPIAENLLEQLDARRNARLTLSNGVDVTERAHAVIRKRVAGRLPDLLRVLDCVIGEMDRNVVKLVVLIANIGLVATMVDCVARTRGVPSYLIINGFMSGDFLDESKYASVINAYSSSIKEHYYRGMDNIVCLGDPRMDSYVGTRRDRSIDRECPTVTIGTSAHSIVDLNSYLAVEFDFMSDILSALRIVKGQGASLRVVVKVRANGYREQYQEFVKEFFPGMVDEFVDNGPFSSVLGKTDFYISLYSQTLFEASCLGIPCLYYKNDCEVLDPPFDGKSELVTATNIEELVIALQDFMSGHPRYEAFLQKPVMEKYIGPLDGKNLERNQAFIYELLAGNLRTQVV